MASSSKRKRPMVVSRHGRYRFQTGLITASLLKRGLAMEEAFAISTELRQQLRGREEIGTEELEEMLQALVLEHLGENAFSSMGWNTVEIGTESPLIRGQATLLPFSRGILLRYLVTAGLEPEAAMSLAQEIQRWLRTRGLSEVGQLEVDNEVELLLTARCKTSRPLPVRFCNSMIVKGTSPTSCQGGRVGRRKRLEPK